MPSENKELMYCHVSTACHSIIVAVYCEILFYLTLAHWHFATTITFRMHTLFILVAGGSDHRWCVVNAVHVQRHFMTFVYCLFDTT